MKSFITLALPALVLADHLTERATCQAVQGSVTTCIMLAQNLCQTMCYNAGAVHTVCDDFCTNPAYGGKLVRDLRSGGKFYKLLYATMGIKLHTNVLLTNSTVRTLAKLMSWAMPETSWANALAAAPSRPDRVTLQSRLPAVYFFLSFLNCCPLLLSLLL